MGDYYTIKELISVFDGHTLIKDNHLCIWLKGVSGHCIVDTITYKSYCTGLTNDERLFINNYLKVTQS